MQSRFALKALALAASLLAFAAPTHAHALPLDVTPASLLNPSSALTTIATQDLARFVQHNLARGGTTLPAGFPLNVSNPAALQTVSIAYGFPVYTVDPQRLLAGEGDLSRLATPSGSWRFVLYQQGQPVGLATLEQVQGRWQTVAYGGMGLARDVDAIMKAHGNASHTNVRFIRVFQAQSDLLEVRDAQGTAAHFALLPSAQQAIFPKRVGTMAQATPTRAALVSAEDLMEPLRQAVQAGMRQ